jgi:hypothetical protein
MKIRFCEPVVGYAVGEEHDLPADQGNAFIQSGLARKSEETRFAAPATLRRESDPVSTPPILASLEAGNVADAGPLGSGNPPASRTSAVPVAELVPGPLPAPGPKARAPKPR